MTDDRPDWVAQLDQTAAALRDLARQLAAFHGHLIDENFTADQALQIVMAFQHDILWMPPKEDA